MNSVFTFTIIISFILILIKRPTALLTCFTTATEKAISLSIQITGIYAIWLGFTNLIISSGLNEKLAKLFKPIIKFLFGKTDDKTTKTISLFLSANMLGLSGVATPIGIDAMHLLDKNNNEKAKTMLFTISATSIQLLPVSVMQLLISLGSQNPSIIVVPTLISTFISTFIGIVLCKVF